MRGNYKNDVQLRQLYQIRVLPPKLENVCILNCGVDNPCYNLSRFYRPFVFFHQFYYYLIEVRVVAFMLCWGRELKQRTSEYNLCVCYIPDIYLSALSLTLFSFGQFLETAVYVCKKDTTVKIKTPLRCQSLESWNHRYQCNDPFWCSFCSHGATFGRAKTLTAKVYSNLNWLR